MTRVLAFSDIHGSVPAVEELVASVRDGLDVAVVAGDIGPAPEEFFRALEPLGCPVLYVYGNWDSNLDYDRTFHERFKHLHGAVIPIGDLTFFGFSGCDTQWGKNPTWLLLRAEVDSAHRAVLERLKEATEADGADEAKIKEACDAEIREVSARARDRRRRSYKARLAAIERKRDRLARLNCVRSDKIRKSRSFALYEAAYRGAWSEAGVKNRAGTLNLLRNSGCDPKLSVLVSHERLYRLTEDCPGLGAHFFGHRHGFKLTKQHGTTFVNVSTLDPWAGLRPQYAIVEWTPESGFNVKEGSLRRTRNLVLRCMDFKNTEFVNA